MSSSKRHFTAVTNVLSFVSVRGGGNLSSPPTDPTLHTKTCHKITENTITKFMPAW